jgi:hypothetical protein
VDGFGLEATEDALAQGFYLLREFWAELGLVQRVEVLEVVLGLDGADQGCAVTVFEEMFEESSEFVFIFYGIGHALLYLQSLLQILLGRHGTPLPINHLQREIPHNPQKTRKVQVPISILASLRLNLLRQVNNHIQTIQTILVDTPHRIIDKERRQQHCEEEYPAVVIGGLVGATEALGVDD